MHPYKEYEVYVSSKQKKKLQTALAKVKKSNVSIVIQHSNGNKAMLLLTKHQIAQVEKAKSRNKNTNIKMSKRQLRANVMFEGGFLSMLAGLAARALPTLLTGLASGAISGAVEKAIIGNGLYIQKGKHCYRADPVEGDGLFLSRHQHPIFTGDGMWLKHGKNVYDGKGLLFGSKGPFKNIPILGWIL